VADLCRGLQHGEREATTVSGTAYILNDKLTLEDDEKIIASRRASIREYGFMESHDILQTLEPYLRIARPREAAQSRGYSNHHHTWFPRTCHRLPSISHSYKHDTTAPEHDLQSTSHIMSLLLVSVLAMVCAVKLSALFGFVLFSRD
jgi:hypothetical protein